MNKRYFFRRSFAYIIDLILVAVFLSIVAITISSVTSIKFIAPSIIAQNLCEAKPDLVSSERINELLPLKEGEFHQQVLCRHTHMLYSTFYSTTLVKSWKADNVNKRININYYSDRKGNQKNYIAIDPFLYLLAPLIFALFLVKSGQTLGKKFLGLNVFNDNLQSPDFKIAIKREYLKAIILVIFSIYSFYSIYLFYNFDIDAAAEQVGALSKTLEDGGIGFWLLGAVVISVVIFWYQFGSFIRWNGRAYWDRFTKLNVAKSEDLISKQRDVEISK